MGARAMGQLRTNASQHVGAEDRDKPQALQVPAVQKIEELCTLQESPVLQAFHDQIETLRLRNRAKIRGRLTMSRYLLS